MGQKWHRDGMIMLAVKRSGSRSSTERFVLAMLAGHAGSHLIAFPSVERLVELTGFGRSTVLESLAKLRDRGEIVEVKGGRGRSSTTYRLALLKGAFDDADSDADEGLDDASTQAFQYADAAAKGPDAGRLKTANTKRKGPVDGLKGPSDGLKGPDAGHRTTVTTITTSREAAAAQRRAANMNLANIITNGLHVAPSLCTPTKAAELVALGLVPEARMREVGLL